MAYNPYNDLNSVYGAKVAWGNATTDAERRKQNTIANDARKSLESNGYGHLANQVSASGADANAVKKIVDDWSTVSDTVTGNYKTGVDNPLYNQTINSAVNKNDTYFDAIKSDRDNINGKYNNLFKYANSDLTQSDEYTSAFKNIMPGYTLAAMQGRENEAASGASTNGGNIDSFAAANALRQQAALTAKGQALAHQTGLEAFNARVQNARGILSDMGVYNTGTYAAMEGSINNDRGIANDVFNNEQTSKLNDFTVKSGIAELTGTVPDEWVVSNNPYMNDDGTIKDEYKGVDFSKVMANAKATGNTNAYNAAATARYYKIMGNYGEYGQYDDGNYAAPGTMMTQNAKLNDATIKTGVAEVTGKAPVEWTIQNDAFLRNFVDENGNLKPEYADTDFQVLINGAKAKGDTELANKYAILRGLKIFGNFDKYGQYLTEGDVAYIKPEITESSRQFNEQLAQAERLGTSGYSSLNSGGSSGRVYYSSAAKATGTGGSMTLAQATSALKNGELSDNAISVYNSSHGTNYTKDNPPPIYKPSKETTQLTSKAVSNMNGLWKKHPSNTNGVDILIEDGDGKYRFNPTITAGDWDDLVVEQILANTALSADQKAAFIKSLGIDTSSMGYLIK